VRIKDLKLIRYGHFEGEALEFPESEHDIHVVYGDNEAGKTTILSAIGDTLFSFPERTEYGFKHGMAKLRVGATLQNGEDEFPYVRYKKRPPTIFDDDGNEILGAEKTLREYLNTADRDYFERMFLLDHQRFAAGSRALLAGSGDAGEAVLGAGGGLDGLKELLDGLNTESDGLWTRNPSKTRKFYVARDALNAASKAKRENTVDTSAWKKAKQAADDAAAAHEALQASIREKRIERGRLDRFRRLYGDLNKLADAEASLADLGDVVLLPEGAGRSLGEARTEQKLIENKIGVHEKHIEELDASISNLTVEDAVLSLADEIRELDQRRVQLLPQREDIPRRVEERDALREKAAEILEEIGWANDESIRSRLPASMVVDAARSLVNEHAALTAEKRAALKQQKAAQNEEKRLKALVDGLRANTDLSGLIVALREAIASRQVVQDRRRIEEDIASANTALARAIGALAPSINDPDALAVAILPAREVITDYRDVSRAATQRLQDAQEKHRKTAREAEKLQESINEEREALQVMNDAELEDARENRDEVWRLLSARHIHGASVDEQVWSRLIGDDERGDERYEQLVVAADEGADGRFLNAQEVTEIAIQEKAVSDLGKELSELDDDVAEAEQQLESLAGRWDGLWDGCPITPEDADQGLAWLDQAEHCKELQEQLVGLSSRFEKVSAEEQRLCGVVLEHLSPLDGSLDPKGTYDLEQLISAGQTTGETLKAENAKADELRASYDKAVSAREAADEEVIGAIDAVDDWSVRWVEALKGLSLEKKVAPDALEGHLKRLDDLRVCEDKIQSLQKERIEKMRAQIQRYEADVQKHAAALDGDEVDGDADDVVKNLVQRLQESEGNDKQRLQHQNTIDAEKDKISDLEDQKQDYADTIARFADMAGTNDIDALEKVAEASDASRALDDEIDKLKGAIEKNGDNKSLEELRDEAKGEDLDTAIAVLEELTDELEALEAELPQNIKDLQTAQAELNAIGDEGDAAAAEWQMQQAYADMGDVAERFVRTSTASALLQWSIDRFRMQNQKPLLDKASTLFSILTRGSFERVVIDFDGDTMVLAGRRPDGEVVSLSGMSTGSSDQLYLALRLAAIEDLSEKSAAMPFIGDDLFIHHDDKRTKEALQALTEVSKTCQVILFSHEESFADLAREVLPNGANIVAIEAPAVD
jgi:uncharacterized protein YhaN